MANSTVIQLTDNQKAATYIGWEPNQKVAIWNDGRDNLTRINNPAPDMNQPENCWLLLEALLSRDISVVFNGDELKGQDNYCVLDATCINPKWEFSAMWLKNRNFREGLITVAVKFYDAEHEETQ